MVRFVEETERFTNIYSKFDNFTRDKVKNKIQKIITNPEVGKPMRYGRKGTRELYIKPFRLSYVYLASEDRIVLLDLYDKKKQ